MANFGLFSGTKPIESVTVSFRLPYYTQWGQSLLVCGSEPLLGSWNVKKGLLLSPVHEGDELIWYGTIAVPNGFQCEYSYYVVDDEKNILRWEMGKKRKLLLPGGIPHGERVELRDLWQVLFSFSCFICFFILFFMCVSVFLLTSHFYVRGNVKAVAILYKRHMLYFWFKELTLEMF